MRASELIQHVTNHRRGGPDAINGRWYYVGETGAPAFENSWSNAGGSLGVLRYALNDDELVITGAVTGGVSGTVVFTLPATHRPEEDFYQTGVVTDGSDLASILVDASTGEVTITTTSVTTYTDYSGSLAWTATGTSPSIGHGVIRAGYVQLGKTVHYYGSLTFGNTTTFGTGSYRISLPVACVTAVTVINVGGAMRLYDASTNAWWAAVTPWFPSTSTCGGIYGATYGGTLTEVAVTSPFTWAQDDVWGWNLIYQAA